jgi:hypothetical protein
MLHRSYSHLVPAVAALLLVLLGTMLQGSALQTVSSEQENSYVGYKPPDPKTIIRNAQNWVNAKVVYSQDTNPLSYYPDPQTGYRRDCSGFVSMAWQLSNQPNGGLDTNGLATITNDVPTKDQLQKGDILLNLTGGGNVKYIHVVIFAGWTDANGNPVSKPTQPMSYYDAYEEQGGYTDPITNKTVTDPVALETQNMPYPYWPKSDGNEQDYQRRRLDPSKVQQGTPVVSPTPATRPGGLWISPKNGDTVGNTIHFAAWAYPTHPSDPAIQYVNFTIESKGSWQAACTAPAPSASTPVPVPTPLPTPPPAPGAQIFSCDASLSQLGIAAGRIQISFDVYDIEEGFNLAPNGVHTLTYIPPPPEVTYIGSDGNVWDMTLPQGTPRQLTDDAQLSSVYYSGLAWAPDGKRLALLRSSVSQNPGTYEMLILSPTGEVLLHVPLPDPPYNTPFAWSPDGRFIAYRELNPDFSGPNPTGTITLTILDASTGSTKQAITYPWLGANETICSESLTPLDYPILEAHHTLPTGGLDTFAWSPDQQSILTASRCHNDASVRVDLENGQVTSGYPEGVSYQPGGKLLLGISNNEQTLELVGAAGNTLKSLISGAIGLAVWSHDGKVIYFENGYSIWRIDADGSNAQVIINGTPGNSPEEGTFELAPSLSSDGRFLFYLEVQSQGDSLTGQWYLTLADGANRTQLLLNTLDLINGSVPEVVWRPGT